MSLARAFMLLPVALAAAAAPHPATAQSRDFSTYNGVEAVSPQIVAAAFAEPYGKALVAEFAAALRDSADPECVRAKGTKNEEWPDRARTILLERGALMVERLNAMTDRARFGNHLEARIGKDGMAEFGRLRTDPLVIDYLRVDEAAKFAFIAGYVLENISRYALLNRIKFVRPFSPFASDISSLEKLDPTGNVDDRLKEMLDNDKSGKLSRFEEIIALAQEPLRDATNMEVAQKYGPGELLARPGKDRWDLHDELAGLCVAPPRRQ